MQNILHIYLIITLFAILSLSCEDNRRSPIPDYPVHLELDLLGEYNTFKGSVGECLTFTTPRLATDRLGFGGILVCTNLFGEYCAFDLACPYEVEREVRVRPENLVAVCSKCGSQFDLGNTAMGIPAKGPAKDPLKKYKTQETGGKLVIFR
ncbi:MAG: hypothetical protein LBS01_06350 [Prevotellaceae bacterium]|jgi:nitrite reductase/ring-hydroxylating ferredoxin subunit|nr:hypothetical protein [Prevotellaceae bacterium]